MANQYFIGIDSGTSGAIGILDQDGQPVLLKDYPGDEVAVAHMIKEIRNKWQNGWQMTAAIERVTIRPFKGKDGKLHLMKSSAIEGLVGSYYIWRTIFACHGIPFKIVRPREWQKGMVHKQDGKTIQKRYLATARRMFPTAELHLEKHHHKAAALLIAYCLFRETKGIYDEN